MKPLIYFVTFAFLLSSQSALAQNNDFNQTLLELQHNWAAVNYEMTGDKQEEAFEDLLEQAESFIMAYPEQAETWIWQGIIQSSYAGAKGGFGALSLAKQARDSLQKAIEIDEQALSGSAYTSLGVLYHKVPSWPFGFGDDDDAKELLGKAIAINPQGIDPNYFYGEYLYDDGEYKLALEYLNAAKNAPARTLRPKADKYRQAEIDTLIVKVNRKLKR